MTELNLPLKIKKINKSDIIGDSICCLSASCASMVLLNLQDMTGPVVLPAFMHAQPG